MAHARSPEEELAIQVANVDGIHVDDMNVLEARQREIREYLTTQAACTNDQDLALISEEILNLKSVNLRRQ